MRFLQIWYEILTFGFAFLGHGHYSPPSHDAIPTSPGKGKGKGRQCGSLQMKLSHMICISIYAFIYIIYIYIFIHIYICIEKLLFIYTCSYIFKYVRIYPGLLKYVNKKPAYRRSCRYILRIMNLPVLFFWMSLVGCVSTVHLAVSQNERPLTSTLENWRGTFKRPMKINGWNMKVPFGKTLINGYVSFRKCSHAMVTFLFLVPEVPEKSQRFRIGNPWWMLLTPFFSWMLFPIRSM